MKLHPLTCFALLALALPAPLGAQATFAIVPEGTAFTDLTPDGKTALLHNYLTGDTWLDRDGRPQPIGTEIIDASGLSSDATAVSATRFAHAKQAATRWTAADDWQDLGGLPLESGCDAFLSSCMDISGDGKVIVGLAWEGCAGRAFRWTSGGGLLKLPQDGPGSSRADCISNDARTIGGWDEDGTGSRRPALWLPDGSEQILTQPGSGGEVHVLSDDAKVVGGEIDNLAMYWTAGTGPVVLGLLPGGFGFETAGIFSMSGDGHIMGGKSGGGGGPFGAPDRAFLWTPEGGMESLVDRLAAEGAVVPDTFIPGNILGISDDGRTLVGWGQDLSGPFGDQRAFIATLAPQNWYDAGHALAGTSGAPRLAGVGTQIADSKTKLLVKGGLPAATTWFVVGSTRIDAPMKGGVLVPSPQVVASFPLDAAGELVVSFRWPKGLPSGTTFWWQTWATDPGGPSGVSATNALQSITP